MQLSLFSATINSTILTEEAVVTILKDNDMKERLTEFVKANPNWVAVSIRYHDRCWMQYIGNNSVFCQNSTVDGGAEKTELHPTSVYQNPTQSAHFAIFHTSRTHSRFLNNDYRAIKHIATHSSLHLGIKGCPTSINNAYKAC